MLLKMKKLTYIFTSVLLCAIAACNSDCQRVPPWNLCQPGQKSQNAAAPIPTTDNLVVYLDTSASMAGYVSPNGKNAFSASPDGNTIFSKTLLELRNVVTMMSPQPQVVIRRVDTNISAPSFSDLDLSQASINRGFYNGKETNLAGAIKTFSEPLDANAEEKLPPRFHILVTDGVQSSETNDTGVSCAQGSDSFCVKKQLLELLNKGWGGAILGLRGEFQGAVYSEVAKGNPVPFSSGKDTSKFRPFYLYIFSPDRAALDKLVDSLRQKLAPLSKEDALREYALTTDYASGAATVEIAQDKQTKELLEVRQEKGKDGENPRVTVTSSLDTVSKGGQQFVLSVKPSWSNRILAAGTPNELASLIKWELKSVYPEKEDGRLRYSNFKLVKQEIKNGNAELTFESGWSRDNGSRAWRMFRLVGKLDTDKTAPPWVSAWTTSLDTTVEAANKTLNIESSLANLWKNSALENYSIAEVCVRVGEK
jgi:hypothetical protein